METFKIILTYYIYEILLLPCIEESKQKKIIFNKKLTNIYF